MFVLAGSQLLEDGQGETVPLRTAFEDPKCLFVGRNDREPIRKVRFWLRESCNAGV
jgi:hypothetical protein